MLTPLNYLHAKVRNIVSELASYQTPELLSILTEKVARGTPGEGPDPEGGNSAVRALEVEYLGLVGTGRPPLPAGPWWRLHQVLGSQGLSGGTTAAWLLHSLRSEVRSETLISRDIERY